MMMCTINKCQVQLNHSNLAHVMIIQFVNIKLLIDRCLSKGFPGQLHEALRKCINMIFVFMLYVRVAQSVEYVPAYSKSFYLWTSRVRVPLCTFTFFFCFSFLFFFCLFGLMLYVHGQLFFFFFCLILFHHLL